MSQKAANLQAHITNGNIDSECSVLRSYLCAVCMQVSTRSARRKAQNVYRPLDLAHSPVVLAALCKRLPKFSLEHHLPTGVCPQHRYRLEHGALKEGDLDSLREMCGQRVLRQPPRCSADARCRLCRSSLQRSLTRALLSSHQNKVEIMLKKVISCS